MTLYENTALVVNFIERVVQNPLTTCNKCQKWHRDKVGKDKGVCRAYKKLTFKTDFCLKEFKEAIN